jgi:hypothetical protein
LHYSSYAGGLGWAYFEVAEEFGASLPSPARTLRKHQMRDAFRPLIRGVADRLATARRAAAAAAVARPVDRTLAASKAAAVAAAASPAHLGGVGAAATPRHPTTKARAVVDKSVAAPAPAPAVAAPTVAAALAGPAPAAPPFPSPALTTADTTTDGRFGPAALAGCHRTARRACDTGTNCCAGAAAHFLAAALGHVFPVARVHVHLGLAGAGVGAGGGRAVVLAGLGDAVALLLVGGGRWSGSQRADGDAVRPGN